MCNTWFFFDPNALTLDPATLVDLAPPLTSPRYDVIMKNVISAWEEVKGKKYSALIFALRKLDMEYDQGSENSRFLWRMLRIFKGGYLFIYLFILFYLLMLL